MSHFCPNKDCGADTYICQVCATVYCSVDDAPAWLVVPRTGREGNVCPKCVAKLYPTSPTFKEYAESINLSVEDLKAFRFKTRLARLNKLVELRAPQTILFNEAILVAKACLEGDDIGTEKLIERLQAENKA